MAVKEKTVNDAKVIFEDAYNVGGAGRWLDAQGEDVVKFILQNPEPVSTTLTRFTVTATGSSTALNSTTAGEGITITTGATEYNGVELQAIGEQFRIESGKPFYFGCKLAVSEATQSDLLLGLCETDTTCTAASSSHAIALGGDGYFFSKLDAVTTIIANEYVNGASTGTGTYSTALDTSATTFEIYFDGTTAAFYVDDTLVAEIAGNTATNDLRPTIAFRAGSNNARTCDVYWLRVIQCR